MKKWANESGQAVVMTALAVFCVMGFTGMGIDVGMLFQAKRAMQTAADAAAIAGAQQYVYDQSLYVSAGKAASAANGYTDGTNGVTVTVGPPTTGPHAGMAGAVQAVVSQPRSTFFMKILGFGTVPVSARAVAAKSSTAPEYTCVYVLAPTGVGAMTLRGSFDVTAQNCGVVVNSSSAGALLLFGRAGNLTAGSVGVVGTASGHTGDSATTIVTGIAPSNDPLYGQVPTITPDPNACTAPPGGNLTNSSGPGCYSGAININNVTLSSGTYVFTGNVSLGTVTGSGVTLYLLNNLTAANGTINLSPPTSGPYEGIVIAAPNDNGTLTFDSGTASGSFSGIIYAPQAAMSLQNGGGGSGLQLTSDLIVSTLNDQAESMSIASYTQANPSNSPLLKVVLLE
jgi:hypothetical protein